MDNKKTNRKEHEKQVQERQNVAPADANEKGHRRGPGRPPNTRRRVNNRWESEGTRLRRRANYMAEYRENQPENVAAENRERATENRAERRAIPEVHEQEQATRAEREGPQRDQILEAQRIRMAQLRTDEMYVAQENERNRERWRLKNSIVTQEQFQEAITKSTILA